MGSSRRWKRARHRGRSRGRGGVVVDGAPGGVMMSDVLADFAEPLLEGLTLPDDAVEFELSLKIAALLWNALVDPPPGGPRQLYADLRESLGDVLGPVLEERFDATIARGRALYPRLRCLIMKVDVRVAPDGRCTINVLSTA